MNANSLIRFMIESMEDSEWSTFVELTKTDPPWWPKLASVDLSKSTKTKIYIRLDLVEPMSKTATNYWKNQIVKNAEKYFNNVSIIDSQYDWILLVR